MSSPSILYSTSIKGHIFASDIHTVHSSPPFRSQKFNFRFVQERYQTHQGFKLCNAHPPRSCLTLIQVPRILCHHHPCVVSPPSSSPQYFPILVSYHPNKVSSCASQLNPGPISPPSRSHDQHPNSIWTPRLTFLFFHVESHLNPGSHIYLPPPSRW